MYCNPCSHVVQWGNGRRQSFGMFTIAHAPRHHRPQGHELAECPGAKVWELSEQQCTKMPNRLRCVNHDLVVVACGPPVSPTTIGQWVRFHLRPNRKLRIARHMCGDTETNRRQICGTLHMELRQPPPCSCNLRQSTGELNMDSPIDRAPSKTFQTKRIGKFGK